MQCATSLNQTCEMDNPSATVTYKLTVIESNVKKWHLFNCWGKMPSSLRKDLLPMKAHYLFFYSGIAPIILFMSTYAKQLGLSPAIVGSIYTVLPIMGMLGKLVMGTIADKFQIHKFIQLCFISIALISFFSLIFVHPMNQDLKHKISCKVDNSINTTDIFSPGYFVAENYLSCSDHTQTSQKSPSNCKMKCSGDSSHFKNITSEWENTSMFVLPDVHFNLGLSFGFGHFFPSSSFLQLNDNSKHLYEDDKIGFDAQTVSFATKESTQSLLIKDMKIRKDGLTCVSKFTSLKNYSEPLTCYMICDTMLVSGFKISKDEFSPLFHYEFWLFFTLMVVGWIGSAVVTSVGDSICFGLLGDFADQYGIQRLWGSVGWGLCAPLVGFLIDYFSIGKLEKDYTPLFYLVAAILSIDLLVSTCLKEIERPPSPNIAKDIGKLFLNARILLFFAWCIFIGIGACMIWNFLFWHLEALAGCNQKWIKTLEGLLVCFKSYGGELPFFFLNSWLLRKLGHINCMTLVLFAFGIKFLWYSLLENPWWSLPIELLGGLTFSTFYATMASYASIVAPTGTEATVQGIVGALYEGVGISLGSFIGGLLINSFDSAFVFRLYGIITLILCFLHSFAHYLLERNSGDGHLSEASSEDSIVEEHDNVYTPDQNGFKPLLDAS